MIVFAYRYFPAKKPTGTAPAVPEPVRYASLSNSMQSPSNDLVELFIFLFLIFAKKGFKEIQGSSGMLFREALNQFQHKPNVPFCIFCGNKWSEDGRQCDDCSSCPTTDKKQNFLVLYSKEIDFLLELDLYHSTVTSTEMLKDKIFPRSTLQSNE